MGHHTSPQIVTYAITIAVIALVLALRWRGTKRASRLRLETLWIVPALFGLALVVGTYEAPPPPTGYLWLALAAAVGGTVGWQRGRMMRITVDPETHELNQQSSPAAFLFIVLLIVARQGLRYEGAQMGINVMLVTGLLMAFTFGLLAAARTEMFVRAQRLLAEARAGRLATA